MITILGPTACGKTSFAVRLAATLDGEIISGDSRQVYRRMDIGTGKDLDEYTVDGIAIPHHLIDIVEPGTKYNVCQFQHDFLQAYRSVVSHGRLPILCGGSGLYLESVLRSYRMSFVPENKSLRESLTNKSLPELTQLLTTYKTLHNTTDVDTPQRAVRAIEIADYYRNHPDISDTASNLDADDSRLLNDIQSKTLVVGLLVDRDVRRQRISYRLQERLKNGMVEEVKSLIDDGVPPQDLIYYGLEYKYLTLYIVGELSYEEMVRQLEIAIHQFAKRQMTWFRGMERRGIRIHWIDAELPMENKVNKVNDLMKNHKK